MFLSDWHFRCFLFLFVVVVVVNNCLLLPSMLFLLLLMLLLLLLLFWGDEGTVGFQKKALVPAEVPTATGCYLLIIQCVGQ